MTTRRNFLTSAAIGTLASLTLPKMAAAGTDSAAKKITLNDNDVILFQGDSITDAGRDKKSTAPNMPGLMGNGYAYLAAANLLLEYPEKNLKIYNKGISGNKVFQLADRWDTDCLDLKPNVLSILVGVNDFWHTITSGYTGTVATYRTDFKKLLDRTRQALPDVKLIIGEPFGVLDIKAVTSKWYPAFNDYRLASKEIADEFGAVYIPYQSVFDKAQKNARGSYWTGDGVHPTVAGANLMAQAWLKTVKG
jgi:lysophospholipase L1-like esterase